MQDVQRANTDHQAATASTARQIHTAHLLDEAELTQLVERVKPYTLLAESNLRELGRQVCATLALGVRGDFVECGVYRGGACFLVALILQRLGVRDRAVWMFDSFEGVPPPTENDGPTAELALADWAARYRENLSASLDEVRDAAHRLGVAPLLRFAMGWFDQTLPRMRERVGAVAILRIDADWYASVRCCLENLYDQVSPGGLVIIDDYFMEGCALAVHEFLGARRVRFRLETTSDAQPHRLAMLRKSNETWQQTWAMLEDRRAREEAAARIQSIVREGDVFILVDDDHWDRQLLAPNRTALPFLERGGQYWGPPPDDASAIAELERMRRAGARYIFFAPPALWWLDHYTEFRRHLESTAARVTEGPSLTGFSFQTCDGMSSFARRLRRVG